MKRVFVTGAGGMVGSAIYPLFKEKGYDVLATDKDVNEQWLEYLDVRDKENVQKMISGFKPDLIIHLAALTSLEYCEQNLQESYEVNFIGTKNVALVAKELDVPLVHISTAGVFDGEKDYYEEHDLPNPLNVYGKTKLYGELFVENFIPKHFIIKPGWMFGGGKKDKKFVSYIAKQILAGKKEFFVVNDKFGTPTYVRDLARNIEALAQTKYYGKYNMVCEQETNRLQIAKAIFEIIGLKDARLHEVGSDYFKKDFSVPRAASEVLLNSNLKKNNLNLMRHWREALKDYLETDWKELFKQPSNHQ
jgi:dTDP-4-dehydrorhamnose reductase